MDTNWSVTSTLNSSISCRSRRTGRPRKEVNYSEDAAPIVETVSVGRTATPVGLAFHMLIRDEYLNLSEKEICPLLNHLIGDGIASPLTPPQLYTSWIILFPSLSRADPKEKKMGKKDPFLTHGTVTCLQSGAGLEYNVSSVAASAPRILPSYEMSEGVRDSLGRLVFKDHAAFTPSLTPKQVSARLHPSSRSCLPKKSYHGVNSPHPEQISYHDKQRICVSVNSDTAHVRYRNIVRMDMPYLWD